MLDVLAGCYALPLRLRDRALRVVTAAVLMSGGVLIYVPAIEIGLGLFVMNRLGQKGKAPE